MRLVIKCLHLINMPGRIKTQRILAQMKVFMPENTPDGRGSKTRGRLLGPSGQTCTLHLPVP